MTDGKNESDETIEVGDGPAPDPDPYVHEDSTALVPIAAQLLDQAFASGDGKDWQALSFMEDPRNFPNEVDPISPLGHELRHIVGYEVSIRLAGQTGADLIPRTRADASFQWPPAIDTKSQDVKSLWDELSRVATHPRAIARLEDLLFVSRVGNRFEHAIRAITNYEAVFDDTELPNGFERTEPLLRAWELSRQVGQGGIEERLRQKALDYANRLFETGTEAFPGVVLPLVGVGSKSPRRPTLPEDERHAVERQADDLIETAFQILDQGRFATEIVELKKSRLRPDETLDDWRRREVEVYANEARQSSGFVKQAKLEDAIHAAKRYGFHEMARTLTAELQRIPRSELKMVRFTTPIEWPMELVERLLSGYTESADWRDGFAYFLRTPPATGDVESLRQQARDSLRDFPLQALFPVRMLNPARLPTWQAEGDEDAELHAMSLPADTQSRFMGAMLAEGLERIRDRYGVPGFADLVDYLSVGGKANVRINEGLARAFILFWRGDYDEAAHLALPKIEASARLLLMELDAGVYEFHRGQSVSGYPYLRSMLDELEKIALDPSWAYYLKYLLTSPFGANLRNNVAHGIVPPIGSTYAAMILRAATLLSTLTPPLEDDDDLSATLRPPIQPRSPGEMIQLLTTPVPHMEPYPLEPRRRLAKSRATAASLRLVGRIFIRASRMFD